MNQKSNLLSCILNVDYMIAGVAFIILVSVTFVGVIMRYVFGSPFAWLEELQLFCFIWMAFMGGCIVFRQGSHICIDILVDVFPQKLAGMIKIGAVVVNTGVLIYLMSVGIQYVMQMNATSRMTNILRIPYALIYAILPVGCVLMVINQFVYLAGRKGGRIE
ncbi:MAG: TRAP transporter small permease [Enterocloster sp.]|nr:TRAP transporter small permease [Enterocloster sp.]